MTIRVGVRGRPPFWRDLKVLRVLIQVVAVVIIAIVGYVLWFNLINNLERQRISTGFEFLGQPVGVTIAGSDLSPGAALWRALLVGVTNTFALAAFGLPLLTVIGVLVGVGRLSTNWLVSKAAAIYVETLRNIPPLLVILTVFYVVILPLPRASNPANPFGLFVISNLQISVPWLQRVEGAASGFGLVMVVALLLGAVAWLWRTHLNERTGQPHHRVVWALAVLVGLALAGWLALGRPVRVSVPRLDGRVVSGGLSGFGAYFAMLIALVLYTASHVAEIVRGSIQAVSTGQTEAANALALSAFQRLRFVVLPQAMRIAIPPVINQYLNFTKNTSLGIAIGYAEVTLIAFQAVGNGQPAPQLIMLLMLAYLMFSLSISAIVNYFNSRLRYIKQ